MTSLPRKDIKQDFFATILLILAGTAVYANTLHVPWYFDDYINIVKNPQITDLAASLKGIFSPRGIGTVTFALNYSLHGFSLPGYHLVNIAIHLATVVTVYLILKRLSPISRLFPLLGSLIFLLHPLQTQAVTYIVQRYASLAGLFLFLSLYSFIRARESISSGSSFFAPRHITFYLLMVCCGAAAVLTKQNTVVLPLLILLYDRYFLAGQKGSWKKVVPYISPFLLGASLVLIKYVLLPLSSGQSMKALTATEGVFKTADTSPLVYFVTEFTVLWKYIRLLILPYGQTLDYDMPLVSTLLTPTNLLAGGGLLLLALAGLLLRRSHRLLSFGIFWFFLSLAVESSFIPLDAMYEHRLYIPLFGFVLILLDVAARVQKRGLAVTVLVSFSAICAFLAWQRNALWADPVAFFEDNLRKAPHNTRVHISLSQKYIEQRRYEDARKLLVKALEYDPYDKRTYNNLGLLYFLQGDIDESITIYKKAIGLDPGFEDAYTNLGISYSKKGEWEEARRCLEKSIAIRSGNYLAHFNLGVAHYNLNQKKDALPQFLAATRLKPDDPDAWYNLAVVSQELGDNAAAEEILPRLRMLNAGLADSLAKSLATTTSPHR